MPEEKTLEMKDQPGAFFYLMNRIDGVDQKLSAKIDRLDDRISDLEDKIDARINTLENKLEDKMDRMRQEFREEIGKLGGRIDMLDGKIDALRYWAVGVLIIGFGGVIAAIKL